MASVGNGAGVATQRVAEGTLIEVSEIGAYGLVALAVEEGDAAEVEDGVTVVDVAGAFVLENAFLQVTVTADGEIERLYDKVAARSVLPEGERANVFQAFEDRPMTYDAWDIDIYYDEKQYAAESATSAEIIETGPLRVGVRIERPVLNSRIVQTIYLYRGRRRLDFETQVDWRERNILLKVAFPVQVLSPLIPKQVNELFANLEQHISGCILIAKQVFGIEAIFPTLMIDHRTEQRIFVTEVGIDGLFGYTGLRGNQIH